MVGGEVKEEIPLSLYDAENETVMIFYPSDSYRYEVVGTSQGSYGLEVTSAESGVTDTFNATEIPTETGTIHQYTIDWEALSQDQEGVTVQIDFDGDGTFEQSFTSDNELTQSEFLTATASGSAKGAGWFVRDGNFRNTIMLDVVCDQGTTSNTLMERQGCS